MDVGARLRLAAITSASACRNSPPKLRTFLLANIAIMGKAATARPPIAMEMGAPMAPMLAKALACSPPKGRIL